jgi:hypothetical protein
VSCASCSSKKRKRRKVTGDGVARSPAGKLQSHTTNLFPCPMDLRTWRTSAVRRGSIPFKSPMLSCPGVLSRGSMIPQWIWPKKKRSSRYGSMLRYYSYVGVEEMLNVHIIIYNFREVLRNASPIAKRFFST